MQLKPTGDRKKNEDKSLKEMKRIQNNKEEWKKNIYSLMEIIRIARNKKCKIKKRNKNKTLT